MRHYEASALDPQKAEYARRLACCKDAILRWMDGYEADVRSTRDALREEETENARNHNFGVVALFANRWVLPFFPDPSLSISDLRKFLAAPHEWSVWSEGAIGAVLARLDSWLPCLTIDIDVRYPVSTIVDLVERQVRDAQERIRLAREHDGRLHDTVPAALVREGFTGDGQLDDDVGRYERMVAVRRMEDEGRTHEQIAEVLDVDVRTVSRYVRLLKEILRLKAHWAIAPSTNPHFVLRAGASGGSSLQTGQASQRAKDRGKDTG